MTGFSDVEELSLPAEEEDAVSAFSEEDAVSVFSEEDAVAVFSEEAAAAVFSEEDAVSLFPAEVCADVLLFAEEELADSDPHPAAAIAAATVMVSKSAICFFINNPPFGARERRVFVYISLLIYVPLY